MACKNALVTVQRIDVAKAESFSPGGLGIGGEPGASAEWQLTIAVAGQAEVITFDGVRDNSTLAVNREFLVPLNANQENLTIRVSGVEVDDTSANDPLPVAEKIITPATNWEDGQTFTAFSNQHDDFGYSVVFSITCSDVGETGSPLTSSGVVRAAGFSDSGTWASRFLLDLTTEEFAAATQKLFDEQKLRVFNLTPYTVDGELRWAGICRSGDWASRLLIGLDEQTFFAKAQELFDTKGLRLTRMVSYVESGVRRWAGVARSGDWASRLVVGLDDAAFAKETQRLFDEQGLRLVTVHAYEQDGRRRWAGICRSGDWASRFRMGMTTDELPQVTQELFDKHGLRPLDLTTYVDGGVRRWAAVYRSGDWGVRMLVGDELSVFNQKRQELFDKHGLRISDFVAWEE